MPHKILLATPSPLYAPVFHAWATAEETFRKDFPLAYPEESTGDRDKLVDCTLKRFSPERILLSIGDLTRLHRCWQVADNYRSPVIVSGLIDQLCLWLLDGPTFDWKIPSEDDLHGGPLIMCNPKYMTTYHAAFWYAREVKGWSSEAVNTRLRPIAKPGFEKDYHKIWTKSYVGSFKIAYMSTELPSKDTDNDIIVDFPKELGSVSMTGMFTSDAVYDAQRAHIDEFCERIKNSMSILFNEGDRLAWELYQKKDRLNYLGINNSYQDWLTTSSHLVEINGYSTNLALTAEQLRKMVDIRAKVEKLDADLLFEKLSDPDVLRNGFQQEKPPEAPKDYLGDTVKALHKLHEQIAENSEDFLIIPKRAMAHKIFRSFYFALAIGLFISEWLVTADSNAGLWQPLGLIILWALAIVIVADAFVLLWRPRRYKFWEATTTLLGGYLIYVVLIKGPLNWYGTEGLLWGLGTVMAALGTWIRRSRWQPNLGPYKAWRERLSYKRDAANHFGSVLVEFSRSSR